MRVSFINWGATIRDWRVPTGSELRPIVQGFETFDPYPLHGAYFGAIAGRVANRIGGAAFCLDGRNYTLDRNDGNHQLHGGRGGLSHQIWKMETDTRQNAIQFSLRSPDGDMGYPGEVHFTAIYRLSGNRLTLELTGNPDRPTPISLVQHHYFNLGRTASVQQHVLHLPYCRRRTMTDDERIPTGEIAPVEGTDWDFTTPRQISPLRNAQNRYDGNFVLGENRDPDEPVAILCGEDGALTLRQWTDRPGLQFYNSSLGGDCPFPGLEGRRYGAFSAVCLEDQMFPDAVNQPKFPSIIATPDQPYRHRCAFEIGTVDGDRNP